ncbi:unnamed protein product [Linum trigynum]|uniref:UspA domain-containing protein n=1 Tax=Linum trigynum TaxID=586398 RepID=A0AAV2FQX8_9ROSI
MAEKQVMVVGIDDSEHSVYALQWTLDHFFTPLPADASLFNLVLVHAKPTPTSFVGLAGPGATEVLPYVDSDLKKIVARVVDKAKQICNDHKSLKEAVFEVVEGDAPAGLARSIELQSSISRGKTINPSIRREAGSIGSRRPSQSSIPRRLLFLLAADGLGVIGSGGGDCSREIEGKSLRRWRKQEEEGWIGHGFDFWVG